ncbi:MAG TPA: YedE-related selenium metabolism membrane protein, partial [Candidatus Bathyarchaeia archaeon]|nr:YedE-related selenium metabolism membrane protein [Candidatus Bathyarchaeia archaeon]
GQPIAHTNQLWNFGGMVLAGLAFTLAGGCPGRQLFLSGEGDADAAVFILGMIVGAGFAHNFAIASSSKGPDLWGPASVIAGLIICFIIGFSMSDLGKKMVEAKR